MVVKYSKYNRTILCGKYKANKRKILDIKNIALFLKALI